MLYCNHDRPVVPDRRRDCPPFPGGGGARLRVGSGGLGAMITLDNIELRHGARVILSGLSGTIRVRQPDRADRSERIGQDHAAAGDRRTAPLADGRIDRHGLTSADIALLAQGSHLDRSFPITCRDVVALAATRSGAVPLDRPGPAGGDEGRAGPCRPGRDGGAAHPGAVRRAVPARAVRPHDRAGRAADPAGRAVHRRRCRHDALADVGAGGLARARPHRDRRAARHGSGAAAFPPYDAADRPVGAVGQPDPGLQAA